MFSKAMSTCALAALCGVLACAVEDPELPEVSDSRPGPALAQSDSDEFRVSYECAGGEEIYEFTSDFEDKQAFGWDDDVDFYCLTRCEGHEQMSRARKSSISDPSSRTDSWCLSYAANFCARLDRELESWCWGTREEDSEDD